MLMILSLVRSDSCPLFNIYSRKKVDFRAIMRFTFLRHHLWPSSNAVTEKLDLKLAVGRFRQKFVWEGFTLLDLTQKY